MLSRLVSDVNNKVISVWGLDGASKTSSIKNIQNVLLGYNLDSEVIQKPGGTPLAEELRSLFKQQWSETINPFTELMMMAASFSQSTENRSLPALSAGKVIVEDRGWGCTYSYQIHGRNKIPIQLFDENIAQSIDNTKPRHILFLDVDPKVGLERVRGRGELDRLELESLSELYRRQSGYRELAVHFPDLIHVVDANRNYDEVQEDVRAWAFTVARHIAK
jgi:dTMP kinase